MERYFIGRLKRINEAKYLFFNIIKMNPDTLEKNKNNGKYEIGKLIFQNNFNYIFGNDYKYINIPRYIMIFIDREKSHNNTSGKSFPTKFTINIKEALEYLICGFIIRKIENNQERFISIYLIKKGKINEWKLSEGDNIKKFENEDEAIKYSEGLIEMVFYKKKS